MIFKSKKQDSVSFNDIVPGSSIILESINDAVLLMDGINFIDCNQKAIELYGCSFRSELLGLRPYELSPEFQPNGKPSEDEALKKVNKAIKGKSQFFEWKHKKINGELIDTEVSLNAINSNGKKYLIAVVRDITTKKKNEMINSVLFNISKSVFESKSTKEMLLIIQNEINRLMQAQNFFVALTIDKEKGLYTIPYIKDEHEDEIVGPEEILKLKGGYTDYVVRKGQPLLANREKIKELLNKKEINLIGADSQSWLGVPLKSKNLGVIGALVIQDYCNSNAYSENDLEVLSSIAPTTSAVIEEKKLSEKLINSEERFKQLFENIPDAVFFSRFGGQRHGEILIANSAAAKQTGYSVSDLIGMNLKDILPLERYEKGFSSKRKELLKEKNYIQFVEKKRRNDGSFFWTEVSLRKFNLGKEQFALSVNRDITEKLRIEEELKKSEIKFKRVIEEAGEIIFTTDAQGYFTYANPSGIKSSGYSLDELTRFKYVDLILPEFKQKVQRTYFKQFLRKIELVNTEYPFRTKSGEIKWFNQNSRLIIDNGQVNGFFVIARDVTDIRNIRIELEKSEKKFRSTIENSGIGFVSDDKDGNIVYFNKKFAEIFGYSVDEIEGKSHIDFLYPEDFLRIKKFHGQRVDGGNPPKRYEFRGIKKDGSTVYLEIIVEKVLDENNIVVGTNSFIHDITERKLFEQELLLLRSNLEKQVEEKTAELNQKIVDLEKFHDATVEREFRIKDLNDKIKELEKELKWYKSRS